MIVYVIAASIVAMTSAQNNLAPVLAPPLPLAQTGLINPVPPPAQFGNNISPSSLTSFCQQVFPNLAPSDGTQNRNGACSSTPQGAIPNVNNMVSTIITNPASGATVDRGLPIVVSLDTANLALGNFNGTPLLICLCGV